MFILTGRNLIGKLSNNRVAVEQVCWIGGWRQLNPAVVGNNDSNQLFKYTNQLTVHVAHFYPHCRYCYYSVDRFSSKMIVFIIKWADEHKVAQGKISLGLLVIISFFKDSIPVFSFKEQLGKGLNL